MSVNGILLEKATMTDRADGRSVIRVNTSWRKKELDAAKEAAEAAGLSLSAWLRQVVIKELEQRREKDDQEEDLDDLEL